MRAYKYSTPDEIIGQPKLFVDDVNSDDADKLSVLIGRFTGIDQKILLRLIDIFGIEAVLNNPDVIGFELEQVKTLKEISEMLHFLGE